MTEEEAKTKWCPMARAYINGLSSGVLAGNKQINPPDDSVNCIASGCMMWVAEYTSATEGYLREVTGGHCGLAK